MANHDVLYSAQVVGMDELVKTLTDTADRRARRLMLKVLVAGTKPLRAAIRSEVPPDSPANPSEGHKPGDLRRSVRYKASRKSTGQIAYMVGPFGKGSAHRHLVIYGHKIAGAFDSANHSRQGSHRIISGAGARTRSNNFVERGENKARAESFEKVAAAAKSMIEELGKP